MIRIEKGFRVSTTTNPASRKEVSSGLKDLANRVTNLERVGNLCRGV